MFYLNFERTSSLGPSNTILPASITISRSVKASIGFRCVITINVLFFINCCICLIKSTSCLGSIALVGSSKRIITPNKAKRDLQLGLYLIGIEQKFNAENINLKWHFLQYGVEVCVTPSNEDIDYILRLYSLFLG